MAFYFYKKKTATIFWFLGVVGVGTKVTGGSCAMAIEVLKGPRTRDLLDAVSLLVQRYDGLWWVQPFRAFEFIPFCWWLFGEFSAHVRFSIHLTTACLSLYVH